MVGENLSENSMEAVLELWPEPQYGLHNPKCESRRQRNPALKETLSALSEPVVESADFLNLGGTTDNYSP